MQKNMQNIKRSSKQDINQTVRNPNLLQSPKRSFPNKKFVFVTKTAKTKESAFPQFIFRKPLASVENKLSFSHNSSQKKLNDQNKLKPRETVPENKSIARFNQKDLSSSENEFSNEFDFDSEIDSEYRKNFKQNKENEPNNKTHLKKSEKPSPRMPIASDDSDKENRRNVDNSKSITNKIEERKRALQPLEEKNKGKEENTLSYGDIVEKGKKFFSKNFELHTENLPSSKKSIARQISLLKKGVYPFSYEKRWETKDEMKGGADDCFDGEGSELDFIDGARFIMRHLRETEEAHQPPEGYMRKQIVINERMRLILLDWLAEVHMSFHLHEDTFFLAVNLIGRFLAKRQVGRSKFQLLGCAALFLASKFTEVCPPVAKDFVYVADASFTNPELYGMELSILKTIQWRVTNPPHITFCNHFLELARANSIQRLTAFFLLELSLFHARMNSSPPSLVAASAVFVALHSTENAKQDPIERDRIWQQFLYPEAAKREEQNVGGKKLKMIKLGKATKRIIRFWDKAVLPGCGYKAIELRESVLEIKSLISKSREHSKSSIKRKYAKEEMQRVSEGIEKLAKKVII